MFFLDYKLICMDMDGTLLNNEKEISERSINAIKAAQKKGVKAAICTGRLFTSADYYASLIGTKVPVIAANGAYIREKDEDRIIYKSPLSIEKCRRILNIVKDFGLYPHFNTPEAVITEKIIYTSQGYIDANKTLPPDRQIKIEVVDDWEKAFTKYEDDIMKCIIVDEDMEKINEAKKLMAEQEDLFVVSSLKNNFEVMNKGVSKGRAVEILAGFYGVKREEVICIGDNENDLSMIEYAGMGVAMGNGEDFVKKAAEYITDTNNNEGVAKAIEKLVLGNQDI